MDEDEGKSKKVEIEMLVKSSQIMLIVPLYEDLTLLGSMNGMNLIKRILD